MSSGPRFRRYAPENHTFADRKLPNLNQEDLTEGCKAGSRDAPSDRGHAVRTLSWIITRRMALENWSDAITRPPNGVKGVIDFEAAA